ncbi:hypothetical protein ACWET9_40125 [Streptomyces sp. NPDC004059]
MPHGTAQAGHAAIAPVINLGVRVEFYQHVRQIGEPSEGYLGALERNEGYRAAAVPAVGTYLMAAASLRMTDRRTGLPLLGPIQLPVQYVERHLVSEHEDRCPPGETATTSRDPTVVVHVALGPRPATSCRGG